MEDVIKIVIKQELPFIQLQRELTEFDLAPVTEKENSIRFMFDDDPWQDIEGTQTMKLRFRRAADLDKYIRELDTEKKIKVSGNHYMELSKICKVMKISVKTEEEKEKASEFLYKHSMANLITSIDAFNTISMMMGVTK